MLKKQKEELIVGFKKQLKLIDILKRQKVSVTAVPCEYMARSVQFKILTNFYFRADAFRSCQTAVVHRGGVCESSRLGEVIRM